jgi:hypothetical protein
MVFIYAVFMTAALPKSALSQEPAGQQAPAGQKANINEAELKSFAKVYVQVEKINQSYVPRLKETQDPEQSKAIQEEAKTKIDEALATGGLTKESYTQIVQTVNANDDLRKKVIALINEERKKS